MTMIMTMIVVNIFEAKARLSEYLDAVANGERVLICKRNQPVAELRAVDQARTAPRPLVPGPHAFDVPESFFEPLPDDLLDAFESGVVYPEAPPTARPSRVAEPKAKYRVSKPRRK